MLKKYTEKQMQYLFPSIKTYYKEPLLAVEGQGVRLKDKTGKDYLDCFGGILTVSVGHSRAEVVKAICDQAHKIVHTSTCYLNEPMLEVAETLAKITPGNLQKSFFSNSGTEAIETAITTAKYYTGCDEVISLRHGYHGRSSLATSLTGHAPWRTISSTIPGIIFAHNAYCFRCPFKMTYPGCGVQCAHDYEELIKTSTCGKVAALIAEPIQGVGGFITPPPEYFKVAVEIVRKHGGVFICDEVQTGFGRTGDHMFGIEHWDIEPDLMVFAKGFANGSPIGATIATAEIANSFTASSISTFGGNPITMVAALATLQVITDENLPAHTAKMGRIMFEGLNELMNRYDFIGDVRGKGLMIGIELVGENNIPTPDLADSFMEIAREEGLLVGKGGLYGNVLRVTPPMTITETEIGEALEKIANTCTRIAGY